MVSNLNVTDCCCKHFNHFHRIMLMYVLKKTICTNSKAHYTPYFTSWLLQVKLANQESDIVQLLKRIPLGPHELSIIRERAEQLQEGTPRSRGEALLPIMLASFIFDSLSLPSKFFSFLFWSTKFQIWRNLLLYASCKFKLNFVNMLGFHIPAKGNLDRWLS